MINLKNMNPKILVVGDLMIDHYLWGSSDRISPEAPVQVVSITNENFVLGGAGNVINNLNALGALVDVISVVGNCDNSKLLKNLLIDIEVGTQFLITEMNRITSKKSRIIASQQQVARYDFESTSEINKKSQLEIIKYFKKIVNNYDVILLSDYGKGVLTDFVTEQLIYISNMNNKKVLVDPKGQNYSKYKGAYLLTPNKKEASQATKVEITDNDSLTKSIKILKDELNLELSIITLSEKGVAIFDDELRIHPTSAREVYDVTGAGDTIIASLGFALSCNQNIDDAIQFANLASGIVVGKIGSATATLDEILEYELSLNQSNTADANIKTWSEISSVVSKLKNSNKKIVFTNGCFDILHIGHIKYLEKAKTFGDVLIVGLNSDNSIRLLKGKNRPINIQDDRAYLLASLDVVDFVVVFNENNPFNLIQLIKPDVLVKGGDYEGKEVVGQKLVKELNIVEFVNEKSTSKLINKIKNI